MADRRAQYHTNGAAAYDVYAWNQSTAPQRRPEPQHLPEERPLPQKRQRVKARTALAPFTVVGMLAVACLLVLVVFGYVQLFEATSEVSKLENLGKSAIVVTSPIVRMYYKKLTEEYLKDLIVVSYNEIESNVELQSVGMVTA